MVRGKSTQNTHVNATKGSRRKVAFKKDARSPPDDDSSFADEVSDGSAQEESPQTKKKDRARRPAITPTKPQRTRNSGENPAQSPAQWTLSPVVVSPTDSNVSSDSVERDGFPWDTSERRHRDYTWEGAEGETPLTPPTTGRHTKAKNHTHTESSVPRAAKLRTQAGDAAMAVKEEDPGSGHEEEEDDDDTEWNRRVSRKLFQGMTKTEPKSEEEGVDTKLDIKVESDDSSAEIKSKRVDQKGDTKETTEIISVQKLSTCQPELSFLNFIVPFDVHERYSQSPEMCVARKVRKPFARCGQRRSQALETVLKSTFSSLLNCSQYYREERYDELWNVLEEFVQKGVCSTHCKIAMNDQNMGALKRYLGRLSEKKNHPNSKEATAHFTTNEFEKWIAAISLPTGANSAKEATPVVESSSNSTTAYDEITFKKPTSLSRVDSMQLEIVAEGQPKCTQGKPVCEAIFDVIWQVLTPRAQSRGFIYVLTHHSGTSYRKIGYTTGKVEDRLKQWDVCCHRHHTLEALPYNGSVLYARRVEKLIHAELKEVRKRAKCASAKNGHCEWFEVEAEHLRKVFLKWRAWIEKDPYIEDVGSIWRLKGEMIDHLKTDCEPVKGEGNMARGSGVASKIRAKPGTRFQLRLEPTIEEGLETLNLK